MASTHWMCSLPELFLKKVAVMGKLVMVLGLKYVLLFENEIKERACLQN